MKKVILGSLLCMSGAISSALLIASAMTHDWINDGQYSYIWNLSRYGAMPVLLLFIIVAIVGLLVAIKGITE